MPATPAPRFAHLRSGRAFAWGILVAAVGVLCWILPTLSYAEEPPAAPAADPVAGHPVATDPVATDPVTAADALMKKRTLKGYEEAVKLYDGELAKKPTDIDLKLKLVTALNSVMRTKTKANLITISGTLDTSANKRIWSELGTRSEALAREVAAARPKDIDVQLQYAEAYMYRSASFGIVQAIMKGAADQYQKNANTLLDLDKKADGGVGYVYLGGFFTVAPWPLSDAEKAAEYYELALSIDDKSARNQYYAGLRAAMDEKWDKAEKHLKLVTGRPCTLPSEKDYCGFIKEQAKRTLEHVAKER